MERFFAAELGSSAMTSVWKPERINALWVRCEACGRMEDYELSKGMSRCGQPLPEPPPYWQGSQPDLFAQPTRIWCSPKFAVAKGRVAGILGS